MPDIDTDKKLDKKPHKKKASFSKETLEKLASLDKPIELTIWISADNAKQSGEGLKALIKLLNRYQSQLISVTFEDTTFLQRHYSAKFGDKNKKSPWREKNEKLLTSLQVAYTIKNYYELTCKPGYKEIHKEIVRHYSNNATDQSGPTFKEIVDVLAEKFKGKGTREGAVKFFLDECAGSIVAGPGYYMYSGEIPAPLQYIHGIYSELTKDQQYLSYSISGSASSSVSNSPLSSPSGSPEDSPIGSPQKTGSALHSKQHNFFHDYVGYYACKLAADCEIEDPTTQLDILCKLSSVFKDYKKPKAKEQLSISQYVPELEDKNNGQAIKPALN